jgi:hypothetical protein
MSSPTRPNTPNAWQEHEHLTTPIENQAQKLLDEAGSRERAKHAVDVVASTQAASGRSLAIGAAAEQFARQLGFASYLSLFEGSTPVASAAGKQWFVTALKTQEWVVWNDDDLSIVGTFPSREAAERAVPSPTTKRPS